MDTAKEKDIKDKLTDTWKKEMIRVSNIPNGWVEKRVTLGKGIGKNQDMIDVDDMLDVIADFGINIDHLGEMNPDQREIEEIYQAIIWYRKGVTYLKNLKNQMGTNQNFKGWRHGVY